MLLAAMALAAAVSGANGATTQLDWAAVKIGTPTVALKNASPTDSWTIPAPMAVMPFAPLSQLTFTVSDKFIHAAFIVKSDGNFACAVSLSHKEVAQLKQGGAYGLYLALCKKPAPIVPQTAMCCVGDSISFMYDGKA
jgi:hypothetical protein